MSSLASITNGLRRLACAARRRRWEWLALPILAIPALWPFYIYGLLDGHDVPHHLLRLVAFDQQLSTGMLYPRWFPDMALGYGYPLLNYYGPASYYVAWLFHALGADYAHALIATLAVPVPVAGWGMWYFATDIFADLSGGGLSRRFSRWLPLTAATAYMYAPYLLVNVFIRGAIAELWAQALLPWILWSFRRLLRAERPAAYVLPAAASLAGMAIMHTVSLLLVPPFLIAYLAALIVPESLRRRPVRLGWLIAAGGAAMGLSAFFWLPLLGERGYVAAGSLAFARLWMSQSFMTWQNVLNPSFLFGYKRDSPFQLGLAQVVLAAVGLALARSRRAEWWFFGGAALLLSLAMLDATQPLWFSIKELVIIQFPWRLLSLSSLPLALVTAGILIPFRRPLARGVAALLLMGVIIVANRPRIPWTRTLPDAGGTLSPPTYAQYERLVNDLGMSANVLNVSSDFIPRWVNLYYGLRGIPAPGELLPTDGISLTVQAAGAYELRAQIIAQQPATLRFAEFYFPGWRAWLDGQTEVRLYPSTFMGLQTVDLPAGTHTLRVVWQGTTLQSAGGALSWITLAALALGLWLTARPRWLAVLPALTLALSGVLGLAARPALRPLIHAPDTVKVNGLELLGYDTRLQGRYLDLYPYWYVRYTPSDQELHWQLTDQQGRLLSEARTRPYFDTLPAYSWRTGTLVDDAYRLALPPNLPAGMYTLRVCAEPFADAQHECARPLNAGTMTLPGSGPLPPSPEGLQPLSLRFNDEMLLAGYTLRVEQLPLPVSPASYPLVRAGERLYYTLYWRGLRSIPENYHSFVHLLNTDGINIIGDDAIAGPFYYPPRLWDTFYLKPDVHPLPVPADAPSGLYHPLIGLYRFETLEHLSIENAQGDLIGDSATLPPIKVLNPPAQTPQHRLSAHVADFAELWGYDLDLPPGGLQPGSTFTVTLYYRCLTPPPGDYTQFVHLYHAAAGLAAQRDAPPQRGSNPTSAWVPGEVIADPLSLSVSANALPNIYALQVGLYNPQADNVRLPMYDGRGIRLADDQIILTELQVGR